MFRSLSALVLVFSFGCKGAEKIEDSSEDSQGLPEQDVRDAIDAANYCELDQDCANLGSRCPFGCYIVVNQNEVESVNALMDEWFSGNDECDYDCPGLESIYCDDGGSCVAD